MRYLFKMLNKNKINKEEVELNKELISKFKRSDIRSLVYEDKNGNVKIVKNKEEIKQYKDSLEQPILIYNPNKEKQEKILELMIKSFDEESSQINLKGEEIIINLFPLVTNINLNEGKEPTDEELLMIKGIAEDPSDLFNSIRFEVDSVVQNIYKQTYGNLKQLNELPDDIRDSIVKDIFKDKIENEEIKKEKQLRKTELLKQLAELDKEDV